MYIFVALKLSELADNNISDFERPDPFFLLISPLQAKFSLLGHDENSQVIQSNFEFINCK